MEEETFELPYLQAKAPVEEITEMPTHLHLKMDDPEAAERDREKEELDAKKRALNDKFEQLRQNILGNMPSQKNAQPGSSYPSSAAGGYLSRPSNIYAESKGEPTKGSDDSKSKSEDDETFDMKLVIRSEGPEAADAPVAPPTQNAAAPKAEEPAPQDKAEDEKRKAAERLQKLRNLSFNLNAADPNNEFEAVPAYIRRNMDLGSNTSHVENFYSNYTVKPDGEKSAQISTINTFLDGKKPD
jgi:cell division protein FtsZ